MKTVFPAREEFMDVGLVAHVPDEFVFRGRENAVQCDGQFHDAQIRAEVTAVTGESGDEFMADFLRQQLQLVQLEFLDVFRAVHHVEVSVHIRGGKDWSHGVFESWGDEGRLETLLHSSKTPILRG